MSDEVRGRMSARQVHEAMRASDGFGVIAGGLLGGGRGSLGADPDEVFSGALPIVSRRARMRGQATGAAAPASVTERVDAAMADGRRQARVSEQLEQLRRDYPDAPAADLVTMAELFASDEDDE